MADDNKNLAGDTERTSILPQSEPQVADQTEVLPTHVSQAQTAQLPPVTQQEGAGTFAGTPLESVAESSSGVQVGDEAVAGGAAAVEPASTKASWGKRAGIEGFLALLAAGAVHGQLTDAAEERRHGTALHAGGGEVVALGEEVHGARHGERNENGVTERQVVACDNVGTLGQILKAHHVMVVQSLQQGGAKNLER